MLACLKNAGLVSIGTSLHPFVTGYSAVSRVCTPPLPLPDSVTIYAYVQTVRIESTQFWCPESVCTSGR